MNLKKIIYISILLLIPFLSMNFMVFSSYPQHSALTVTSYVRIILLSITCMYSFHVVFFFIKKMLLRIVVVTVLAIVYATIFSLFIKYGVISPGIIASIWDSNINESLEFLNSHSFTMEIIFFVFLALPFLIMVLKIGDYLGNKLVFFASSFVTLLSIFTVVVRYIYTPTYDVKGFERLPDSFTGLPQFVSVIIETKQLLELESIDIDSKWNLLKSADNSYNYVIIVGESVQQKRFSESITKVNKEKINGWKVYTNAISPATQTRYSVPRILSLNDENSLEYGLNIIDLAKDAGLKTYWYSNQARVGEHDTPISKLAMRADEYHFHNLDYSLAGSDMVLIDDLSKGLQKKAKGNLFILHMIGSHSDFCYRIGLFSAKPDLQSQCYNKTMIELISFINKVRDVVSYDKYKIIYVSDHGLTSINKSPYLTHGVGKQFSIDAVNTPLIFMDSESDNLESKYDTKEFFLRDLPHTIALWFGANAKEIDPKKEITQIKEQDRFIIDSGTVRFLK